jgi:anthranilate phosphoribosyltransferase
MTIQPATPSFARDVLGPLVRGTNLERREARAALEEILSGQVDPVLVGGFLTALTMKGETAEEMTGFIEAMVAAATTLDTGIDAMDIVGTGGDQLHTVNISTMAALTVAGCGVPVAKHGNRAASSSVGSADVLEALGVKLDVTPGVVRECVLVAGIGFMFAPTFHPGLAHLGPTRRMLGFRTIFNVLGPLANPALVRRSLIGVAQPHLLSPMSQVLFARGTKRAILVNSDDGMDELSLGAVATMHVVTPDEVMVARLDAPKELDLHHTAAQLRGGNADDNVRAVHEFLAGAPGPVFDVVCANAALALLVAEQVTSLRDGFALASQAVLNGLASDALDQLIAVSNG